MTSSIFYTTSQAALALGVAPHVLQSNFRRKGHCRGVVPRKAQGGRLYWPVHEVDALRLPSAWEQPEGAALTQSLIQRFAPGVSPLHAYAIASHLVVSPSLEASAQPMGKDHASVVGIELAVALSILQAVLDRVDLAQTHGVAVCPATIDVARAIARRVLRYLCGDSDLGHTEDE